MGIPYDHRDNIFELDMAIFKAQIGAGILDAMMPAHVIYPEYDSSPASGSSYWLKDVLRKQLNFNGLVFSDDLSMEGATIMGGPAERSQQALDAGCDMVLMCNNRKSAVEVLDNLAIQSVEKANNLLKTTHFNRSELLSSKEWKEASSTINKAYDKWKS
jgi:beta-N-acetylhexosaminidase